MIWSDQIQIWCGQLILKNSLHNQFFSKFYKNKINKKKNSIPNERCQESLK